MTQPPVRNAGFEPLAKRRAAVNADGRSLEADLRKALEGDRLSPEALARVQARMTEIRAMTPDVAQTPSETLLRDERDGG